MKEKVLQVLQRAYPEIDFLHLDILIDYGGLDPLTLTGMIDALTMEFGITIPYEDLVEENFDSVDAIAAMVERLRK